MPFIPNDPTITSTWTVAPNSAGSSWIVSPMAEVFDLLTDIDGNHIIDSYGNYISLGGGIPTGAADMGTTWTNLANISTTWTPTA